MATEQLRELLQRAGAGDQEAFRQLHLQYFPRIVAMVRRRVWNPQGHPSGIANAVMASFFLRHLSEAELLAGDGIWTVLCRLAMRRADTAVKQLTRQHKTVSLHGEGRTEDDGGRVDPEDDGLPPEVEVEVWDLIEYVSQHLPENGHGRQVMELLVAGDSTDQIADKLAVDPRTVYRWRERILAALEAASTRTDRKTDADEERK